MNIFNLFCSHKNTGTRFGNFDVLKLIFGILDAALRNGSITPLQARTLLIEAMPGEWTQAKKEEMANSMVRIEEEVLASENRAFATPKS